MEYSSQPNSNDSTSVGTLARQVSEVSQPSSADDCYTTTYEQQSPISPNSVYKSYHLKENGHNALVKAFVLSSWDNIVGPRIECAWHVNKKQLLTVNSSGQIDLIDQETFKYVGTHTLNGEICRDIDSPHIDTKFYMLKDRNINVLSFVFVATSKLGIGVHSLGMIMSYNQLEMYLLWHELIETHLTDALQRFRVRRETNSKQAIEFLTKEIQCLLDVIASLYADSLHQVNTQSLLTKTYLCVKEDIVENLAFLSRAISSHIMNYGHSIVIGRDKTHVNKMVATLAMFNTTKERGCSRMLREENITPYPMYPNLYVQGILVPMQHVSGKDLLNSLHPTSVVNLDLQTVQQTLPCNQHAARCYEITKQELISLYQKDSMEESYSSETILSPCEQTESLVSKLLQEITHLPEDCGARGAYVENFNCLVYRLAFTLITIIETEMNINTKAVKLNYKKIRQDLGLSLEGDFKMVLSVAEKLKPGMFAQILGDPKQQTDNLVNQIQTM